VGSLFSEQTITAENYRDILTWLFALLKENERDWWFQQDGLRADTGNTTVFLQEFFSDGIVGRGLGHHDCQTLTYLTSMYGDFLKKESTAITKETWRTVNITQSTLYKH